ncbi:MAG: GDSL-type esterase/lipase family protein [Acidimicrobiia bacterium]|nr:GDSL-type esterase/lipase family protein [Acidimicrobiia bacterium]
MPSLRSVARPFWPLAVLGAQLYRAGHRSDLPSLTNQDPSGTFGDQSAPRLGIALLGDSTVTSPGVEPLDACWPRQIAFRLSDRYRVDLHSVAVGGSKTRDVLLTQVDAAIALQPDIFIVSVGGNDALRGTPVVRFEREYDAILSRLTSHSDCVAVSGVGDLGSIPRLPAIARAIARNRARAFDRTIRRVVRRYPQVLKTDTWSPGWDEFNTNPVAIFGADQFHASTYGHRVYTAAMQPAIDILIGRLDAQAQSDLG